jgi:hypothetical protein
MGLFHPHHHDNGRGPHGPGARKQLRGMEIARKLKDITVSARPSV